MKLVPSLWLSVALSAGADAATVINDAALKDRSHGENWAAYGRSYDQQRFSPMQQIRRDAEWGLPVTCYRIRSLVNM